jgi:hypothetical protein
MPKLDNPLILGLACATLDTRLHNVLIFDATSLDLAAQLTSQMLTTVTGQTV